MHRYKSPHEHLLSRCILDRPRWIRKNLTPILWRGKPYSRLDMFEGYAVSLSYPPILICFKYRFIVGVKQFLSPGKISFGVIVQLYNSKVVSWGGMQLKKGVCVDIEKYFLPQYRKTLAWTTGGVKWDHLEIDINVYQHHEWTPHVSTA